MARRRGRADVAEAFYAGDWPDRASPAGASAGAGTTSSHRPAIPPARPGPPTSQQAAHDESALPVSLGAGCAWWAAWIGEGHHAHRPKGPRDGPPARRALQALALRRLHRPPLKWGNPFAVGRDGTREQVIERYERWLADQPALLGALGELEGRTLGCWCAPKPCHGEVLARLASERAQR